MAAKAGILFLSLAAFCVPALANVPRASSPLNEKPHQGVAGFAVASHRGPAIANALIATGIGRCLCDEGRRSRSTGKERDAETGLDYFETRYLSAAQGRFTSPDPLGAGAGKVEDPQSWNLYAYARNNPLLYTDPDGMKFRICDTSGNCYDEYADEDFYKNFTSKQAKKEGITFKGNKVLKDGKEIGTWQRLSFDDLSPAGSAFFAGMSDRSQASNAFIATFAASSALVGATGGTIAYYSGATSGSGLTTLGLRSGHGAYRLALRGFTEADISLTKTGRVLDQADGAKVFVKEIAPGKFNVIVEGEHGVVSALKNISQKALERLSRNYGWK